MEVNRISAISDGLKYANGLDVKEQNTKITSQLKDSIFNPIQIGFSAMEVNSALKTSLGVEKTKDIMGILKDSDKLNKAIEGKKSTNIVKQWNNTINNIIKKTDDAAIKKAQKAAGTGILSKIKAPFKAAGRAISSAVKSIPGVGKAIEVIKTSKLGKVVKGTGAVGMMVFDGIMGLFTEVIPAFAQGGVKSGMKQLGKTAVKTAATGIGWAGGTAAATALGAAIGSVFPGVGTIIGGAIGTAIGGILGSTLCTGIANKILGKSESEKLQDKQFDDAANMIAQDEASLNELNALISQQVQTEIANGTADDDTELMAEYLNKGAFSTANYTNNTSYTPNINNTTTNNTATFGNSYWNQMANKVQAGDTSIYNISDEKLQSVFNTNQKNQSGISNNTGNNILGIAETQDRINYFATA